MRVRSANPTRRVLVGTGRTFSGLVASTGRHEMFYVPDGLYAAPGADCGTIQGGRGAPEIELPLERPVLQQSVDKAGVEDVSRTSGIDHGH